MLGRSKAPEANGEHPMRAPAMRAVAELVHPAAEDAYWRDNFASLSYSSGEPYDIYQPAFRHGWEAYHRHNGRAFDAVERKIQREWERTAFERRLSWEKAKRAMRDAWQRIADADGDMS